MHCLRPPEQSAAAFPTAAPTSGTLVELLRLVGAGALSTDELELAPLVGQYRKLLERTESIDLDDTGEIIALAARLMLLKSARVLAQPADAGIDEPEEDEAAWLEPAALSGLAARLRRSEGLESLTPPVTVTGIEPRFAPRPVSLLQRAWHEMAARGKEEAVPVPVPAFVRLESAVSKLIRRLKTSVRLPFRRLVARGSRSEVVIQFLAVLELVRRRTAEVEQEELFGDMTVEYRGEPRERAARAG